MEVRTTRFGNVSIADDRIIHLPKGMLGFSAYTRFCLLEPADDACFFWLQSVEEPSLAFVVTDPNFFVPDYSVPIRQEQMDELGIKTLADAQVFVIVNKVDNLLTGNMQGPVVINTLTRTAEQFVLSEKRWTTRHPLFKLNSTPAQQAMTA